MSKIENSAMLFVHLLAGMRASNISIVVDNAKRPKESATELSHRRQRKVSAVVPVPFPRKEIASKSSSRSKRTLLVIPSASDARWESVPLSPKEHKKGRLEHINALEVIQKSCEPLPLPVRRKSVEIIDAASLEEAVRKSCLPLSLPVRRVSADVRDTATILECIVLSELDFADDDDDDEDNGLPSLPSA
jgi:hypothetical protein